jgi:cyclopropane fatty-acyl-phospholipid synthase-like methyltransferase
MDRPHSHSCDRNQNDILKILKQIITHDPGRLLEIGSGTGQHAIHMAPNFPDLEWVTSDVERNHEGIKMWLKDYKIPNIHGPVSYEVGVDKIPYQKFDYIYCANAIHIMSWKKVKTMIKQISPSIHEGAQVIFYGPFNYDNEYTCESNEKFDGYLKGRDEKSGIRNFEDVKATMEKYEMDFTKEYDMPSNNKILLFTKIRKAK